MTISTTDITISALTALAGGDGLISVSHARVGIVIFALVLLSAGNVVSVRKGPQNFTRFIVMGHILIGWTTFVLGLTNCVTGLQILKFYIPQYQLYVNIGMWIFLACISVIALVFILFGEPQKLFGSKLSFYPPISKYFTFNVSDEEVDDPVKVKERQSYFGKIIKRNLPHFEWDDVNKRVHEGCHWLIMDGIVYDVGKYIESDSHPGGLKPILKLIGTDATLPFYGSQKKSLSFGNILPKKFSADISDSKEKSAHRHSRFAHWQLSLFAIGILKSKILDDTDSSTFLESRYPFLSKSIIRAYTVKANSKFLSPNHLNKFKITSRTPIVGRGAKTPVYLYRFTSVRPYDGVFKMKIFPGSYVQLHIEKGDTFVKRKYFIPCSEITNCFDLIISCPKGDVMDIVETDIVDFEICGPMQPKETLLHLTQTQGCYPTLIMLVQGHHIACALNLASYYVENGWYLDNTLEKQLCNVVMVVFIASDKEEIMLDQLFQLQKNSQNRFKYFQVASIVFDSNSWNGLTGNVSADVLDMVVWQSQMQKQEVGKQAVQSVFRRGSIFGDPKPRFSNDSRRPSGLRSLSKAGSFINTSFIELKSEVEKSKLEKSNSATNLFKSAVKKTIHLNRQTPPMSSSSRSLDIEKDSFLSIENNTLNKRRKSDARAIRQFMKKFTNSPETPEDDAPSVQHSNIKITVDRTSKSSSRDSSTHGPLAYIPEKRTSNRPGDKDTRISNDQGFAIFGSKTFIETSELVLKSMGIKTNICNVISEN
ncbi:hypothetical protein HK098_001835 [Nowakowskiella sp. JEL0407]|nr:hypothetical protein HK098_001835 [Nowakowskiella sp. JEL0407]